MSAVTQIIHITFALLGTAAGEVEVSNAGIGSAFGPANRAVADEEVIRWWQERGRSPLQHHGTWR